MYTDCTKDIADSSPQIKAAICDIQKVARGDYAAFNFWLKLQNMTNDERVNESKELDKSIEKLNEMAGNFTKTRTEECDKDKFVTDCDSNELGDKRCRKSERCDEESTGVTAVSADMRSQC